MFLPGSLGGVPPRAALAKIEESLWYPGEGPPSQSPVSDATDIGLNLGVQFATTVSGDILSICFWRWSALASSNGTVALWNADERITPRELVASKDFTGHSGTGWRKVDFDEPVPVSTAKSYIASVWIPESGDGNIYYGSTLYAFSGDSPVYSENLLLWAWPDTGQPYPPHGIAKRNGSYKYGDLACPDAQVGSSNYWVDVVFRGSPLPAPPDPPIVLKWDIPEGYPNLSNTGVPPGTVLTQRIGYGAVTTADGQIIEDLDIRDASITVNHHNCIVRRCKIYFRGGYGIGIPFGILGTIIEDCDINSGFRNNGPAQGIGGVPLAIRRCNIYRGENGIAHFGSYGDGSVQQVIEDNFVHSLRSSPGTPHYDCLQFNGGNGNIVVRHNTFHNENTDTSAILIQNLFGAVPGIRIEDNIMAGGGYTSYCVGRTEDPAVDPIVVQYYNNQFHCGAFGYIIDTQAEPDMAGNKFMDHGGIYDFPPADGFVADQVVRERFFGMPNGVAIVPGSVASDAVSGITLGVSFQMSQDATIVGVNIPKIRSPGETLTYKVGVWRFTGANRNAGTELLHQETINFTSGLREGWEHLALTTPVAVDAGDNVLLGVWCPPGADGKVWFTVLNGTFHVDTPSQFGRATAFNGAGVPLNGFTGGNGLFNYGSDLVPPLNQGGARPSYNIDPILEAPWVSSGSTSISVAGQQVVATAGQPAVITGGSVSARVAGQQVAITAGNVSVTAKRSTSISLAGRQVAVTAGQVTATGVIPGTIPLTYTDARFSSNTTSASVTLSSGTLLRKTITDTGATASIIAEGNVVIDTCRVDSAECVRMAGNVVDIRNCYLEATGVGDDHADVIQAYDPGQHSGTIIVSNTSIVAHTTAATAGLFVADDWGGTVTLNNVVFNGGPFGLRLHADPGCTLNVYLKDVFFVGPFGYNPFLIEPVGSGILNITHWENVRNATIVGGVLVPGSSIPEP
jgi:hypothetical protein